MTIEQALEQPIPTFLLSLGFKHLQAARFFDLDRWMKPDHFGHAINTTRVIIDYWNSTSGWFKVECKFHGDSEYDQIFNGKITTVEELDMLFTFLFAEEYQKLKDDSQTAE